MYLYHSPITDSVKGTVQILKSIIQSRKCLGLFSGLYFIVIANLSISAVFNSSKVGTAESLVCENMSFKIRITITLAVLIWSPYSSFLYRLGVITRVFFQSVIYYWEYTRKITVLQHFGLIQILFTEKQLWLAKNVKAKFIVLLLKLCLLLAFVVYFSDQVSIWEKNKNGFCVHHEYVMLKL